MYIIFIINVKKDVYMLYSIAEIYTHETLWIWPYTHIAFWIDLLSLFRPLGESQYSQSAVGKLPKSTTLFNDKYQI